MKKDYYTFVDLIVKLRKDYKDMAKTLRKMEKCIGIIAPCETKFELNFSMRNPKLSESDRPKLVLYVTKTESSISEKLRKSITSICKGRRNPVDFLIDNATFCYYLDSDKVTFEFVDKFNFEHAFRPTVMLTDESYIRFRKLCDKLKKNILYSLPDTWIELNPYQSISMNGRELSLYDENGNNYMYIDYDPKIDKVKVKSDARYHSIKMEELLTTKIPRYLLGEEFTSLLDKLPVTVQEVNTSNMVYPKEAILSFKFNEVDSPKTIGQKK